MLDISTLKRHFDENKDRIFEDYFTLLRFKSVATDPSYRDQVENCADWLFSHLQKIGLKVEKWEGEGSPVLFASHFAGADKETVLIYGHYDVQPVDPLDEWLSPPFEPTIREGEVYARGAVDNKGQCFYTLTALEMLLKHAPDLPVNIKIIIEGEEESGSMTLSHLLDEKRTQLKADYLLIVDSGMNKLEAPSITLGARGIVCMEVCVREAAVDLHSGMVGGMAYNPNRALAEMIATLHDGEGHVTVPGFYDGLVPITDQEKNELDLSFDSEAFHSHFGFDPTGMENSFTPMEAACLRPTLEINGLWGGYTGTGFKTVIPAATHAKISCRLVPGQDPDKIAQRIETFLKKSTPKGLETTLNIFPGNGCGFRTHSGSKIADILCESYSQVFGTSCKKSLIGGTIPIAVELAKAARAEMVLVGLSLPGDRIHAPNEHFGLDRFEKGYLTICRALELFKQEERS